MSIARSLAVPVIRGNFQWLPSQYRSAYSLIDRLFLAVWKHRRCLRPKHKLRILQRNKSNKRAAYANPNSKDQILLLKMIRQGIARLGLGHDPFGRRDGRNGSAPQKK